VSYYDAACWGTGQALLSEQCDEPLGCTPEERRLHADNLGSSGEDGVGIDIDPGVGGLAVGLAKGPCCRGHVIIMKLYDDEGREQRISRTQIDEVDPIEELDADFSTLGATGFRLTLFDDSGVVIGPPTGTEFIGGGPKPVFTNRCPVGQIEWWINEGTSNNPVWVFNGCIGGYDFVLPGYGPVLNVDSFSVEPIGMTSSVGRLTQCTVTSDDSEGIIVAGVYLTPAASGCACGDLDRNGGPVDLNDFATFATCYGLAAPLLPGCDAAAFECSDLDGNGLVNLGDFATFATWYGLTSSQTVPDCGQ
jgi:hypothetical protein